MKNKPIISSIVYTVTIVAGALILCGCGGGNNENVTAKEKIRVEVQPIVLGDISETLKLTGEVMPFSTVVLTSKVPGRLERLAIKDKEGKDKPLAEGTIVRKGQRLAVIDLATYTARARLAEAAVASAKARFDDAVREEKRMTSLFKEGAATEQMRDKNVTTHAASDGALKQAQAASDLARINLDEATPESPIDGIVAAKHVDEGNIVSPGMPIITIQDISKVKVIFNLPERHLARVVPGKTHANIFSDALEGEPISAVVSSVYPTVDRATRTTKVEVLVNNSDGRLRSGMFAKVEIEIQRAGNALIVPGTALLRQNNETVVYVADGSKASRRSIQLGMSQKDRYEVKQGLNEGDLVVVRGQHMLADGDQITIVLEDRE